MIPNYAIIHCGTNASPLWLQHGLHNVLAPTAERHHHRVVLGVHVAAELLQFLLDLHAAFEPRHALTRKKNSTFSTQKFAVSTTFELLQELFDIKIIEEKRL